jgi:hypothetical protein
LGRGQFRLRLLQIKPCDPALGVTVTGSCWSRSGPGLARRSEPKRCHGQLSFRYPYRCGCIRRGPLSILFGLLGCCLGARQVVLRLIQLKLCSLAFLGLAGADAIQSGSGLYCLPFCRAHCKRGQVILGFLRSLHCCLRLRQLVSRLLYGQSCQLNITGLVTCSVACQFGLKHGCPCACYRRSGLINRSSTTTALEFVNPRTLALMG